MRGVSFLRDTVFIAQKLREVPLDGVPQESFLFTLHEHIQWVSGVTIDVYLREQIVFSSMVQSELLDFCVRGWLLLTELIAGERQDAKTCKTKEVMREKYDW